jgi:hypothetical protein
MDLSNPTPNDAGDAAARTIRRGVNSPNHASESLLPRPRAHESILLLFVLARLLKES